MKSFKGQAALEFMMTYGWAILVVLAAIGALSYFGVLDPSRFTPDTCMGSSGFSCDGKPVVHGDNITFTISNGVGFDLSVAAADVVLTNIDQCLPNDVWFCTRGFTPATVVAPATCSNIALDLKNGASTTVFIDGCTNTGLNIVKGEMELTFSNAKSGLPETVLFTFVGKPK